MPRFARAACAHPSPAAPRSFAQVSIIVGSLYPVFVNHMVAPWFLNEWALSRLAESYRTSAALQHLQYDTLLKHLGAVAEEPAPAPAGAAAAPAPPAPAAPQPAAAAAPAPPPPAPPPPLADARAAETEAVQEAPSQPGLEVALQPSAGPPQPAPAPAPPTGAAPPHVAVTVAGAAAATAQKATGGGSEAKPAPKPKPPTLATMQAPITEVVTALAKDSTPWQRGPMATPHALHAVLAALTLLAERHASLQVTQSSFVCACSSRFVAIAMLGRGRALA